MASRVEKVPSRWAYRLWDCQQQAAQLVAERDAARHASDDLRAALEWLLQDPMNAAVNATHALNRHAAYKAREVIDGRRQQPTGIPASEPCAVASVKEAGGDAK